ncbi:hypothetical protein AB0K51_23865 [Kitasatospora sp. NPDC049285]|uniref:hypothetical protein n=1 Tax=Kitasatospora sp. NPDC049285 TaxID=3157096 RepID=UPI0034166071
MVVRVGRCLLRLVVVLRVVMVRRPVCRVSGSLGGRSPFLSVCLVLLGGGPWWRASSSAARCVRPVAGGG